MSDYTILPTHQLKHLTSEGRRQLFCWIHDEGIHYSQFHTADGSIHLEVDGYGFKRFDCNETFADVQRFIKILKHATANQLSWCDAEKTFQGNRHGKQEAIQDTVKQIEEVIKDPRVVASLADELIVVCKQRDEALQQLQDVTIERYKLSAEIERLKQYALKLDDWNDKLQSEVERMKAKRENKKVFKSDLTKDSNAPEDGVTLKTLCTNCLKPIECKWPKETTFGGEKCTAEEYLGKALKSDNVYICCDNCLEKMPDVRVEDLREKGENK